MYNGCQSCFIQQLTDKILLYNFISNLYNIKTFIKCTKKLSVQKSVTYIFLSYHLSVYISLALKYLNNSLIITPPNNITRFKSTNIFKYIFNKYMYENVIGTLLF